MNDPSTILRQDHREVERLLTALRSSEHGPQRTEQISRITAMLEIHMQLEEDLLYPHIPELLDEERHQEAESEHDLAREGLAKLRELDGMPGFGAVVEMLIAGIRHHVDEEEKEILPSMKRSMERRDWLALGDRMTERKEEAMARAGIASNGAGPVRRPPSKAAAARGGVASGRAKRAAAAKRSAPKKTAPKKSSARSASTRGAAKSGGAAATRAAKARTTTRGTSARSRATRRG